MTTMMTGMEVVEVPPSGHLLGAVLPRGVLLLTLSDQEEDSPAEVVEAEAPHQAGNGKKKRKTTFI